MIKFNKYRYQNIVIWRELKTKFPKDYMLISRHVSAFDRTMKQYNKKRNIKRHSINLAYRLSGDFIQKGSVSKKELIRYLKEIGTCHYIDFHAYELFFAFLILHAIKKLNCYENTDILLHLLRDLQVIDCEEWMSYACVDEQTLLTDHIYAQATRESKKIYRENIMKIAKKQGKTPSQIIENALNHAKKEGKDTSFYLNTSRNTPLKWIYFVVLWGSTVIMSIQLYLLSNNIWLSLLVCIPSYMTSKIFTNHFISSFFKPYNFIRLKSDNLLVQQTKTCVVIYDFLQDNKDALLQKLERTYLQNQNANAVFGLLLDLPDNNKKFTAGEKAHVADMRARIGELNRKYKNVFFVCIRKRKFNKQQEQYICEGHKYGAIDKFIRSMDSFNRRFIMEGVNAKKSNYLLVMDSDVITQEGSILEFMCVACHPFNQPIYNKAEKMITHGYGVLIPRVIFKNSILNSKMNNQFNQLVYGQDSYQGIGLIHIDAYKQIINNTPSISYDGIFYNLLRCGYISDIVFIKNSPKDIASALTYEYEQGKDDFMLLRNVKQYDITFKNKYILFERCIDLLTPMFSFLVILLSALYAKTHFLLYGVAACMPYFAPTYKRLIEQILTGSVRSGSFQMGNNMIILIKSFQRSIWKLSLIPYRALNLLSIIRQEPNRTWKRDIFTFYPVVFGIILNLIFGMYFLLKLQWQSMLFFLWSVVPAIIFIAFNIQQNDAFSPKKNVSF